MTAIVLGLLLGVRHALDADHVVAVTTIVSRERSVAAAARIGVMWGVGHSAMILGAGGAIVLFGLVVPPRLALSFEFVVAIMLIALGVANLVRAGTASVPVPFSPLAVGVVHGLAGSAALSLVVLAAMDGAIERVTYLVVFGMGTIVGMMGVTAAIAAPALFASSRIVSAQRFIRVAAGVASIAFGVLLAKEIGVDQQLFGAAPVWAPE